MQNVKLRAKFAKSLGVKFAADDEFLYKNGDTNQLKSSYTLYNDNEIYCDDLSVASFAPRENIGVQPCGDDVPVCIKFEGSTNTHSAIIPTGVRWSIELQDSDIGTWKPCIGSLIKMQIEHDRKLALTAECEKMTAAVSPKQGDKRRIEFMSNHTGQLEIHAVTYQFETDKEICCIAEDGLILTVDKEEFVAWHDEVDELEAAKKKQIEDAVLMLDESIPFGYRNICKKLQEAGMLAEVILPLKN